MSAHQCPHCELMFSFRTEVEYHVATDHRPPTESPRTTTEAGIEKTDRRSGAPVGVRERVST